MGEYFFHKSIRKTIIQFLDIFNDINIERYDVDGNIKGRYLVPIRYGPKAKAYLFVRDHNREEEMLPMMSVYISGIDFDPNRLTNKYQDILTSDTSTLTGTFAKNAIPYNISFTLSIWSLHMVDIDQIYEQILPYFAPHAFIRVRIPEVNIIFDVKVILNGCSPVMTDDVGESDARVIKWDTTFTVQTWLFKPSIQKPLIGSIGGTGGTGGYSWTSGIGTSGFGSDGTSGKIVNRYYMDKTTFDDRDSPEREIFDDERPSEVYAFRPLGIDEDAKTLLDYEIFSGED